ncbi:ferredoxin-type protein NapF [uncultured Roseovarius sp.]|uniref:ferredoxin-type protein NapF n=1 Tax=uncultured Roseovarius sp. TaxID=293344 RepID=UPI0026284590|nr:ferredoxin-type protein NapF [uncultured Roseovarius sp.]
MNRRNFLRGASQPALAVQRPPWVRQDALTNCTSCNDCVSACPENILKLDDAGLPMVDFSDTGCTFCGDCAASCTQGVFDAQSEPAWQNSLTVSGDCLLASGVSCQLCTDFCDSEALVFDLSQRPVGALRVDHDSCTGCGMCIGACPVTAITLAPLTEREVAA